MGKKDKKIPEKVLTKKEEKQIIKIKSKIIYHEARGGHRPGKIGDKPGEWSENKEYDMVCELKKQIADIEEKAKQRSWE